MSRIGKQPVDVPKGVQVSIKGRTVAVKGPKGDLSQQMPPRVTVTREGEQILVTRDSDEKEARAFHGLARALVANMVTGVTDGFAKTLEVHGVGYNVKQQGKTLVLELGFSNPVEYDLPQGIGVEIKAAANPAILTLTGADKQQVGQTAAVIRHMRPAEPYKGKGVRYEGEQIRRKAGKTFASAG